MQKVNYRFGVGSYYIRGNINSNNLITIIPHCCLRKNGAIFSFEVPWGHLTIKEEFNEGGGI